MLKVLLYRLLGWIFGYLNTALVSAGIYPCLWLGERSTEATVLDAEIGGHAFPVCVRFTLIYLER